MKNKLETNSLNSKYLLNNKKCAKPAFLPTLIISMFITMFYINAFANGNPVANDDNGTRIEDTDGTSNATNIPVLNNDLNNPDEVIGVTQALFGIVEISTNPIFVTYKPNVGYCNDFDNTTDSFTYTITNGSTANVYVAVLCQHVIGGIVTGLIPDNNLILHYSGSQPSYDLSVSQDDIFIFPVEYILHNDDYSVSILAQPTNPEQTCIVINGSGLINHADVVDIEIRCNDLIFRDGFE